VRFHAAFAPFECLSVVVAQELRAGTRRPADRRRLEHELLDVFERSGRIITPSARAWQDSGDVPATLAAREGLALGRVSRAFANDVLLGLSCREAGVSLIIENVADFARVSRVVPVPFIAPGPGPRGEGGRSRHAVVSKRGCRGVESLLQPPGRYAGKHRPTSAS
jgi:predicted nucleic acid-binding protein